MDKSATGAPYHPLAMLIDGAWLDKTSAGSEPVVNPANEEVIGHCPLAGTEELDRAAAAADLAFETWSRTPALERKKILNRVADRLRSEVERIALQLTLEEGKPLAEAKGEILGAADIFEWYGDECVRLYGRIVPSRMPGLHHAVVRHPIGPVAGFSPWNFPALTPARKIAGALAAGCTIIIKPSEETPATCILIAEACQAAGVPKGVLNLVFGDPPAVSSHLVRHPAIRKVSFTGSIPVGKHLAQMAAEGVKRCTLELGGHAPVIVCDDAPLEETLNLLVGAKFRNAGQVCVAPSRFYVQRKAYDRFVEGFAARATALTVGDGRDAATKMGPMANDRRIAAMEKMVADARGRGHEVVAGGGRMANRGYFFEPTVIADVSDDSLLMREEPFGPVAPIAPFDDLDDVLRRANALPFGLAAYAFTGSAATSRALSTGIQAGMVGINSMAISLAEVPFGGVKESGYGSEGGTEGLDGYLETRLISQMP